MSKYEKPVMLVMEEEGAKKICDVLEHIVDLDVSFEFLLLDESENLSNFVEVLKTKLSIL